MPDDVVFSRLASDTITSLISTGGFTHHIRCLLFTVSITIVAVQQDGWITFNINLQKEAVF